MSVLRQACNSCVPAPQYAELAPSAALAPWVACYWSIRAADALPMRNRVLPDGCADVIVDLTADSQPIVVGAMRTAAVVPLAGCVDLFGVRFWPGRALPFLDIPLSELTDGRIPLDAIWGDDAAAFADAFAAGTPTARAACVERILCRRLGSTTLDNCEGDEALATRAVRLLERVDGRVGVRALATALGAGERQLERAFDRSVGLSPKVFGRVLRFRRAVREIQCGIDGRVPAWTDVAFGAGYADQSHLIREFKSLAGLTPAQYVVERCGVGFVQYDDSDLA